MEWALLYIAMVALFLAWGWRRSQRRALSIIVENDRRFLRARALWSDAPQVEVHVDDDGLVRYIAPTDDRGGSISFGPYGSTSEIVND